MGQNADLEESSDDGNQNGYLPRTMTALQYNDELAYIYNFGLWGHGTNGNMAVFEFHLKTALMTGTPLQDVNPHWDMLSVRSHSLWNVLSDQRKRCWVHSVGSNIRRIFDPRRQWNAGRES